MTMRRRFDADDPQTWQAYVDDAMEPAERAEIEAAMAADPALAARVADAMRLRARVRAAFDPVLDEPMPERFAALLATPDAPSAAETAPVAMIATATATATATAQRASSRRPRSRGWRLLPMAAAAAVAAVAVGLGWRFADAPLGIEGTQPFARGALAEGLDSSLASVREAEGAVAIGLTFRDRDGRWCRSFAMPEHAIAGLACRVDGRWTLPVLHAETPDRRETWRQAASPMSPALIAEIDARIAGEALSAEQERAARDAGWR